jgi:putative membrane protein insertion efficiency factor
LAEMNPLQHILLGLLRFYRWAISPLLTMLAGGTICRFEPSCSQYAMEAVKTHGAIQGSWFTLKRLARCHPWGGCGHDPVPEVKQEIS